MRFAIGGGVFLVAFSLLFLEIVATRVLASVMGPESLLYTVALAMLGLGAAGSLSTLTRRVGSDVHLARRATWLCLAAAAASLLLFGTTSIASEWSNRWLDALPSDISTFEFYRRSLRLSLVTVSGLGLFMALAYFFHGLALTQVFRNVAPADISVLYAADLVGAFAGALAAVAALEFGGFGVPLAVAVATPLLAAAAFGGSNGQWRRPLAAATIIVLATLALPRVAAVFEPSPHLSSLARLSAVDHTVSVERLGHWWTSYGLISAIEIASVGGPPQTVMVHGTGEGHARVVPFGEDQPPNPVRVLHGAEVAIAACDAKRVLVLLAGPGTEMVLIDRLTEGRSEITGVELISRVVSWPVSQPRFNLEPFFADPRRRLVVAEAREYLARDRTKYDCILVSWSGASRSYYTGMVAASPNNIYTIEGVRELLNHLTPGGQLTILDLNKVRLMLTAAGILTDQGIGSLQERFVVLGEPELWDSESNQKLLIKPAGFSEVDVASIRDVARRADWDVLYAPSGDRGSSDFWFDALHASAPATFVNAAAAARRVQVTPSTDDRPFVYDLLPPQAVFQPWFWLGSPPPDAGMSESVLASWRTKRRGLQLVGFFCALSVVLILGPLALRRRTHGRAPRVRRNVVFFACLGAGFMLIEMGLIQKLRLLVGHPGYTLAVVLASIVLFAGIGSFASGRLFSSGVLTLGRGAVLTAAATVACILVFDALAPAILALPQVVKMLLAFLLPAVPAFFMGQLFPQGLARLPGFDGEVSLQMAVNAVAGTIASGLAVSLAQLVGYNAMILCGVALYLIAGVAAGRAREMAV